MILHGYDINGLLAILGKVVVGNNRLSEDLQQAQAIIVALKEENDELKKKLEEATNGRLE